MNEDASGDVMALQREIQRLRVGYLFPVTLFVFFIISI